MTKVLGMKTNRLCTFALSALLVIVITSANALAANPCALPENDLDSGGIGGTGHVVPEGGIGGTGHQPEGGIGGTGQKLTQYKLNNNGKLAVVGVVTGFASVCVNGIEIHYNEQTLVSINGESSSTSSLAVGQVVSLTADSTPKGWNASKISTNDAVSGPVTKFLGPDRVEVLGQTVNIPSEAIPAMDSSNLAVGQHIRVQGTRLLNGEILATSATRAPNGPVVLTGAAQKQSDGTVRIGGVKVGNLPPQLVNSGQDVSVTGRMVGTTLQASKAIPAIRVDANAQQLSVQAAIVGAQGGRIQLGNGTVIQSSQSTQNIKTGTLVHISAYKDSKGIWQATRVTSQSHSDLMRRAGSDHQENSSKESSKNSGRDDSSSSGSSNQGSSNSGSNSGSESHNDESNGGSNSGSDSSSSSGDRANSNEKPSGGDRPSGGEHTTSEDRGGSGKGRGK